MMPESPSAVSRFVEVATKYRDLVDRAAAAVDLLAGAETLLPALYVAALELPDVEASDEREADAVPHEAWREVFGRLQEVLGLYATYREVYDPVAVSDPAGAIDTANEPVIGNLADDLADIWRDLEVGLRIWPTSAESMRNGIVWEWRESFKSHWGQHLVDALRAIHWWRYVHYAGLADEDPAV